MFGHFFLGTFLGGFLGEGGGEGEAIPKLNIFCFSGKEN